MAFNVQKMPFWHTNFQKNLPTVLSPANPGTPLYSSLLYSESRDFLQHYDY